MLENIYNLFMFYTNDVCYEIGVVNHKLIGTDNKKIKYLQDNVTNDSMKCNRYMLSSPITREEENISHRLNKRSKAVLETFKKFGISEDSLVVITPIVDNKVFFDCSIEYGANFLEKLQKQMGIKGNQIDWLAHYNTSEGIDISSLINDDYFAAIRLTFQNRMYLSSMKLLMSCIDSIGYIEFGSRTCFKEWLNEYANLERLGITADELWEMRNSILHMSNLDSQKIVSGKVRRISFFVADNKASFFHETESVYYFNFKELIDVYADALKIWINSYNEVEDKFLTFIAKYDQTVSDNRLFFAKKSDI